MAEIPQAPAWLTIEKESGPATKEAIRLLWLQHNKTTPSIPDVRFIGHPIQTGMIVFYAGSENPDTDNYGICDGGEESRVTRAALFDRIGTIYGVGDGSTTFNRPDYRGKPLVGVDTRDTLIDAVGKSGGSINLSLTVPAHTHTGSGSVDAAGTHDHSVSGTTSSDATGVSASASVSTTDVESDAVTPVTVVQSVDGVDITDPTHDHTFSATSGSAGSHQHTYSHTTSQAAAVDLTATAPFAAGLYLIKY